MVEGASRVAILISGGGSNMVKLVESMQADHPARPVLVASSDPEAAGLARARALGVATVAADHRSFGSREAFEDVIDAALREAGADLVALAGFMRILTPGFVTRWQGRMMNIHPSLLPKYKGLHTHARALAAGDSAAGCTVHEVVPDLDAGAILGQAQVPILAGDTPETLAARVLKREHLLYPQVLRAVCAGERLPIVL